MYITINKTIKYSNNFNKKSVYFKVIIKDSFLLKKRKKTVIRHFNLLQ